MLWTSSAGTTSSWMAWTASPRSQGGQGPGVPPLQRASGDYPARRRRAGGLRGQDGLTMSKASPMSTDRIKGLICRECSKEYPAVSLHVCDMCFGPLEVQYDYKVIKARLTRTAIEAGPKSLWRYVDLLPVAGEPTVGLAAGFTPLVRAKNLGDELGLDTLYIKNDTVNHPTLSFKDRVVSVAL